MKKILLIVVCLLVTGSIALFVANIHPSDDTVGSVIGNAVDGAIDDVVNTYHAAGNAIKNKVADVVGSVGTWFTQVGSALTEASGK